MPFGIGPWEIVALAIVALLLFGSARLPQLGRQLGRGARDARKEYLDVKRSFDLDLDERPEQGAAPTTRDETRSSS